MKAFIGTILKSLEAHRLASIGKYDEAKKLMVGK